MNKIAKTFTILAATSCLVVGAFAQGAGPTNPPVVQGGVHEGQRQTQRAIMSQLSLTKDQQAKIKAQMAKMKEQMKQMRDDFKKNNTDKTAMRKKMLDMRQQNQDALKGILTADQFKKYQDLVTQARDKAKAERAKNKGAKGKNGATGTTGTTGTTTTTGTTNTTGGH